MLSLSLITEMTNGQAVYTRGYAGQSDDSRRGQDKAGQHEISLCYSERCAVKKLRAVYFWDFPLNIFGL